MAEHNITETVRKNEDKIPYAYVLSCGELGQLYELGKADILDAVAKAYAYGFIKGTRAKGKKRVPVL